MPKQARPTKEVLLSLYRQGLNDRQIARAFSVDVTTVYRWKKQYGIEVSYERAVTAKVKGEGK